MSRLILKNYYIVISFVRLEIILNTEYYIVKLIIRLKVSMERKLIRNGNGWALSINKTILSLLKIDPDVDMAEYTVEGDKLIITKSPNKRPDKTL